MKLFVVLILCIPAMLTAQTVLQPMLLDPCDDIAAWSTFQSTGVLVTHHRDAGVANGTLRFDITFPKGSGYGGMIRNFEVPLPENYEITFLLRATVPINNFEVKVSSDSAGENIWWVNNKNYTYPTQWKKIRIKKRHLAFAWGPRPAPHPDVLRRIEIVVTAGTGGSGSVWIDNLELRPLPLPPVMLPTPSVTASSVSGKNVAAGILPDAKGAWMSKTSGREWIEVDFKYPREFGAVRLLWGNGLKGLAYNILGSFDGKSYDTLHIVSNGKGGATLIFTPESEARYLKLSLQNNQTNRAYRLDELSLVPSESLSTENQYIEHMAASAPRGWYPRYFLNQASFWTVVGVPSDPKEALFNEDGSFEVDRQRFSLEPFIRLQDGELLTWANTKTEQSLEQGYLPIPSVKRRYTHVTLDVTLLATGEPQRSALLARYVVKNISSQRKEGSLFLALRPFQVNPTYQWLNFEGGFARTDSITITKGHAIVGDKTIAFSSPPAVAGAAHIDAGEIVEHIAAGRLPKRTAVRDPYGMASAALQYPFDLNPDDSLVVIAAIPFTPNANRWRTTLPSMAEFNQALADAKSFWERTLNTVRFNVPADAQQYVDIVRSNVGYILINKDEAGFQPGSRSYERSWIRDGSMTSAALLKLGIRDDVRRFVAWYAPYQYENGMVPCVVDRRGPDPVPEHDSNGQLIFACTEYFRFAGDTTFLRTRWQNIVAAVNYIQHLCAQRMTSEYRDGNDEKRAFYGLVTESISHEGYSAKPMHSYWDNFFTLKGLKDAAAAAAVLGEEKAGREYDSLARAFRSDLYSSIALAMKNRKVNYIPGCVELGDFDPTSTSIALFPGGEINNVPQPAFQQTFDKYFEWFMQRALSELQWGAFTPYEVRNIGTYIYLGQKERAHKLLEWFMKFQRPRAWNHWAEVAAENERQARFIGDMPHTWVGSDFINAFRAMFVYEVDDESTLVVGAGLKDDWVLRGMSVEGLPTHFGDLSYTIVPLDSSTVTLYLGGTIDAQKNSLLIPVALLSKPLKSATVEGVSAQPVDGFIKVVRIPATVNLRY